MNTKKTVSIGFIAILLMSFAAILPVNASYPDGGNWVAVVPQSTYFNNSTALNTPFDVNVTYSITGLFSFQYEFCWNKTLIGYVSRTLHIPDSWRHWDEEAGEWVNDYNIVKNQLGSNATHQWHQVAITALAPAPAFTGNWTFFEYTLKVAYLPELPEPNGVSPLDIYDSKISNAQVQPIPHELNDGTYEIQARVPPPPPTPDIEVVNPVTLGKVFNEGYPPPYAEGERFNVTVCLYDLVATHDLWGWEVKLAYNNTQLDYVEAYEGDLLPSFAGENGTWFQAWGHPGYVLMAGMFLDDHIKPFSPLINPPPVPPYPAGGVLAIVEFEIIYSSPAPPPESSTLGLYNTKLVGADLEPIDHYDSNATYYTPYLVAGRNIDCFTDPYRKYGLKHFTGYIGMGPNQNADAYEPQDWVTLYALVTYNNDPVQNKLVAYEIIPMDKYTGETREVEGFPLYLTAMTNASGIATISFRIPWPCTDPERVLGGYKCVQKVDVACETIEDDLWFEVGWIIKLIDVEVVNAKKCTFANVTITYENIAIGPFYDNATPVWTRNPCEPQIIEGYFKGYEYGGEAGAWKRALITAVIFDDVGTPIGKATDVVDIPTGYWCHPKPGSLLFQIHIPKWAYLGIGTVYVNAFTDYPSLCGIPYCPEIEATFPITTQ